MAALIEKASTFDSREFLEDAIGLAAICVIIFSGLGLTAFL